MVRVRNGPRCWGRGFLVSQEQGGIIVTAAHCLPRWPVQREDFPGSILLTVPVKTLDGIRSATALVTAIDPFCDLAILSDSAPGEELAAFHIPGRRRPHPLKEFWALLETLEPIPVRREPWPADRPLRLNVFTVRKEWVTAEAGPYHSSQGSPTFHACFSGPIRGGTSGSPVLDDNGHAVGVVCNSSEAATGAMPSHCGMVSLPDALPRWVVC
jgi:hypothetical protein